MTEVEPVVSDFAATGRTGRRNALPDILGSSAADLPHKLAELSVGGAASSLPLNDGEQGGESSSSAETPKENTEEGKSEG